MDPFKYVRFRDLKARGIADSWARLNQLIENEGFPRGRLLSPQVRVWTEQELQDFHASRPVESTQELRGGAKLRREAKRRSAEHAA
jgi:hypothetical protein